MRIEIKMKVDAGCDEISKPVGFVSKKFLNFCGSSFSKGERKPMLKRQ